jgi:chemotaxis protein histidine kinase CheA
VGIEVPVGIKNAAFKAGLDEMRSQAHGFAHAVTGLFAGISLGAMFDRALEKAKDVHELARRFGDSAEDVQKLGAAAKKVGSDMETVSKGGFKAFLEAQKALSGDDSARAKFESLGITLEHLAELRGPRDTIIALADAVHGAANQHVALAAAGELVGARQAALIQLFRQGGDAIRQMGDNAVIMSNKTVDSLAKAQKAIEKFKNQSSVVVGTAVTVAQDVMHGLGSMASVPINMLRGESFKNAVAASHAEILDYNASESEDSEAPTGDAAEESEKEQQATEQAAEKRKKLEEEIADLREKNYLESLNGEQRLAELTRERLNATLESQNETLSPDEKLAAEKRGLELDAKIAEQQKKNDEEKAKRDKETADARLRYANELSRAQADEAHAAEQDKLDKMSPAEKRQYLTDKRNNLYYRADQAERNGDALEGSRARLAAIEADRALEAVKDDKPEKKSNRVSVRVDALQAIGGGGNVSASVSDPSLRQLERQTNLLERVATALEHVTGRESPRHYAQPK